MTTPRHPAAIYAEPKIDCHCHVLDPAQFAYAPDVAYRPAGQEQGNTDAYVHVMQAYGIAYALLVGPNSGYGTDNRCLLDGLARHPGLLQGVAVVPNATAYDTLAGLKAAGVQGVAFNMALHGVAHYADTGPLLAALAQLDMFANIQVEHDQLTEALPLLQPSGVRILVDHCGRPDVAAGLDQPGFAALLALGRQGRALADARGPRALVKLSGYAKFSAQPFPWTDTLPYAHALLEAFGPEGCLWASDWPFLRAPERIDIGPLLQLAAQVMPDAAVRQQVMWRTPARLLGRTA